MFSTAPISHSRMRYPSSSDFSPMMRPAVNAGVNWGHGAGVRRDHLLMPDTVLPVVPGVHWRDPRCFV